jgi:hypothetical protein
MRWFAILRRWLGLTAETRAPATNENAMCDQYNPQDLLEAAIRGLDASGRRFGRDKDRPMLFMGSAGRHGIYPCVLQVSEQNPVVLFYSHVQCKVPAEKRPAVAEFLTRANHGIVFGNFELDLSDGTIRYKTCIPVADGELTMGMVDVLVGANVATVDRYLPGIMSLLWNDLSAEDAVALTEAA